MGLAGEHLSSSQLWAIARELAPGGKEGGGRTTARCPFPEHEDKNPSFVIWPDEDKYKCYSHPHDCFGDLIDLWGRLKGTGEAKADFKAFCDKYGIPLKGERKSGSGGAAGPGQSAADPAQGKGQAPGEKPAGKPQPRQARPDESIPESDLVERLEPLPPEWLARLQKERGWSAEVMARFELKLWRNRKTGEERVAIPIRDEQGRLVNIRKYLLDRADEKAQKFKSWYLMEEVENGRRVVHFGEPRLFPPPCAWREGPIWLTEGEGDCLAALSAGLNAATATGGSGTWNPSWTALFAGREAYLAYDADQAGAKGVGLVGRALAAKAAKVKAVAWPKSMLGADGKPPAKGGQDLTDFLLKLNYSIEDLPALLTDWQRVAPANPGNGAALQSPAPPGGSGDQEDDDAYIWEAYPDRFKQWSTFDERFNYRPILLAKEVLDTQPVVTDRVANLSYTWTGTHWRPLHDADLKMMVVKLLGKVASRNRVGEAVDLMVAKSTLPDGKEMNPRPELLCVQNGMVDIFTWKLYPHDPAYLATHMHPFPFDPRAPRDCAAFKLYLRDTVRIPEVARELQYFTGYCLWPKNPFHMSLFAIGPPSAGKSTYLNLLRKLLGRENCTAVNLKELEDQFQRVKLHRKKCCIFPEVKASFFETEYFKALTGDDEVGGAYKHKDGFDFLYEGKFAFSGNEFPRVSDTTGAFHRRILPVKFRLSVTPDDPRYDPRLGQKLAEELPAIFQWAMVGLAQLLEADGFHLSTITKAIVNQYKAENDPVLQFLEDCCAFDQTPMGASPTVPKDDLWEEYQKWHQDAGYQKRPSKNTFFRSLWGKELKIKERTVTMPQGKREKMIDGLRLTV